MIHGVTTRCAIALRTPDETTLFLNVQHPGEESTTSGDGSPGSFDGVTSYWPRGNKTAGVGTSQPLPSTVAISVLNGRVSPGTLARLDYIACSVLVVLFASTNAVLLITAALAS